MQVLTFYGGMPAVNIENDITNRMERWTGQAPNQLRQESRSIVGASIIRNYYREGTDANGALAQVNSLASAAIPNLPPGTLPPVILKFDPTATTPVCLVALDSDAPAETPGQEENLESALYDTGRYEVRNFVMNVPGAVAPVVYGGRLRTILVYLDRTQMVARNLSPQDVLDAIARYNLFLPAGSAKFGKIDYALDSNSMYQLVKRMRDIPIKTVRGRTIFLGGVGRPEDKSLIQTNIVRVNGKKQVYIPIYRQQGSSSLDVVNALKKELPAMEKKLSRVGADCERIKGAPE